METRSLRSLVSKSGKKNFGGVHKRICVARRRRVRVMLGSHPGLYRPCYDITYTRLSPANPRSPSAGVFFITQNRYMGYGNKLVTCKHEKRSSEIPLFRELKASG